MNHLVKSLCSSANKSHSLQGSLQKTNVTYFCRWTLKNDVRSTHPTARTFFVGNNNNLTDQYDFMAAYTNRRLYYDITGKDFRSRLNVENKLKGFGTTIRFQSQGKKRKNKKKPSPHGRNNRTHSMKEKKKIKIPKDAVLPPVSTAEQAPPLFMYPTASPNAYIASCAVEDLNIHPKEIFQECSPDSSMSESEFSTTDDNKTKQKSQTKIPSSFRFANFEYQPPKSFDFELPTLPIPEVAILGRSNVGKSSLLNALTKQKIARTSKTPGRTQQVNYFALCHHRGDPSKKSTLGYIIDLPGYGYAKAPDKEVDLWQKRTQEFLQQRHYDGYLQRIYLLIDSRHGLMDFDHVVMQWLDEAQIPYMLVLTKGDSVGKPKKIRHVNEIAMRYHYQSFAQSSLEDDEYDIGEFNHDDEFKDVVDDHELSSPQQAPIVLLTSSKSGEGIAELMWSIDADFLGGREKLKAR